MIVHNVEIRGRSHYNLKLRISLFSKLCYVRTDNPMCTKLAFEAIFLFKLPTLTKDHSNSLDLYPSYAMVKYSPQRQNKVKWLKIV